MYSLAPRRTVPASVWLATGVLAIALASGLLTWAGGPVLVPLMVIGLVGGAVILMEPIVGVLVMFAITVLRPEAVQGLGWLNPTNLISVTLAGVLFLTVVLGGPTHFLRSNQIRLLVLVGVIFAVNWVLVGKIEAPGDLADKDLTMRTVIRHVTHLAFVTYVIAFVRTPRHLLLVTGVFLIGLFVTIPGALAGADAPTTKVDAMRAAAGAGGLQAAENANRLAFISLMGISVIWFGLQRYRSSLVRLAGGAAVLVLILTVFRSGSRSGVILLVLLGVLLMWQSGLKVQHIALIILTAFACIGLVITLVPEALLDRIFSVVVTPEDNHQPKSLVESNTRRWAVLLAGLKLFAENPLMGVGIGNFRWMTSFDIEYGGISMAAHNAYLLALAEGGLLLLGAYLLLFGVTARDLWRALAQSTRLPEVGLRWLILATRTNLILLLGFSLFAEAWKEFFFPLILATAGALAVLYDRAAAERRATRP